MTLINLFQLDNVNEYLKLAASADKTQLQRIKAVFEKKNQKSAHNISQLQKKLESYSKRYKDLEQQQQFKAQQQKDYRQPREVLRDVGQGLKNVGGNIRDGVTTGVASVMSKPREFAHLIKNKFGSADNINHMSSSEYKMSDLMFHKHTFNCNVSFLLSVIDNYFPLIMQNNYCLRSNQALIICSLSLHQSPFNFSTLYLISSTSKRKRLR